MPNFHISRLDQIEFDPAKSYAWEFSFPDINLVAPSIPKGEDFIIRCRNAVIPSRGNEKIQSDFWGMKKFTAGKPTFSNTLILLSEEFEDLMISKGIYEWNENVFSTSPNSPTLGYSKKATAKNGYAINGFLSLYRQNGEILEKQWKFYNCFPESIDDVSLDYAGNDSIKYSMTFSFDYHDLV